MPMMARSVRRFITGRIYDCIRFRSNATIVYFLADIREESIYAMLDRLPRIENGIFRRVVRPIDFTQMRSLPREGAFPRILIRHGLGIPKFSSDTNGARV